MVFNRIKYVSFAVLAPLLMLNCFTSEKALPGVYGEGQIVGKVVGTDGMAIQGVTVTTTYQGVTYTKTSSNKGNFTFKIDNVKRGEGFQVHLAKTEFQSTDYATVITLPNLKVDMGNLVMYIEGDEGSGITRQITGQILDNFSFKPLIGANVAVTDSAGQVRTGVTGEDGKFTIQSNYFKGPARDADGNLLPPPYPSYQLSAFKSNYITRTDLIAKMSSDDVPIEDGQIKLYNKFGSVYGYVVEDTITPETPLNGVEAKIVNSNNQTHICPTGGPYNPEPLSETDFCPDMDDDFGTANYGANGGGFKIKSQFIFLGNRYNIELSKTSAACQARTTGATGCYRSKTLFSDIYLTGNNAITGEKTNLLWDSWIEGTVTGGAGAGVVVKLYDVNNTYLTQTTSTAGGKFIFDNPQILRAKVYKMTFEKDGYYARLLGVPDGTRPCGGGTMYQSEVPITITANGSNDVGSVPMT
ncbi:MAG TPA: carboxypeptidase regulatory-like domain-containing protein, partial [Turneriella sp.]|nr:carboxypeptidase regulatory-like domain-containing protein [Turneriella sp.]